MTTIIIAALLLSAIIYLYLGFYLGKQNTQLGDLFPIIFGRNAKVKTVDEFSKSTVAATVSLATIILAYFELAGYFGLWLLWTVLTSALGMWLVCFMSTRIWEKLSLYDHRPSMHEFIGHEFNSRPVAFIASVCTTLGFLLIYATELTVGSRFLAGLVPSIPGWASVLFLSAVGFIYTSVGGFRVVVKTDQLQMRFIWLLIIALFVYFIYYVANHGGIVVNLNKVPKGILTLDNRPGLLFFLFGLTVLNLPAYLSNMSIWQRISGVEKKEILQSGLRKSVTGLTISWTSLTLLACLGYMLVSPTNSQLYLTQLLTVIGQTFLGKISLFFVVLGLYGAMLSTSSTNLIVIGHTISEDIIATISNRPLKERISSAKDFYYSRIILIAATAISIFLVEGLKYFGFSIADLVFAIYGGALALFPLIIAAVYFDNMILRRLSKFAAVAVIIGFVAGWSAAIYGRVINNSNLIYIAPAFSLLASAIIISLGRLLKK